MLQYHRKKLKSKTLKEKIKNQESDISSLEKKQFDNNATIARLQGVIVKQNSDLTKCLEKIEVNIRFW